MNENKTQQPTDGRPSGLAQADGSAPRFRCGNCGWAEQCSDGLFCIQHERETEENKTCYEHSKSAYGNGDLLGE